MSEYPRREFCLKVWGDYACFTRPELKVERVSYDVITPSAARAIFSAVFWKPAVRWHIRRIEVLKAICWFSVRRNEVDAVASKATKEIFIEKRRQQRAGMCLRDVAYRLFAELEFLPPNVRSNDAPLADNGPETPQKYFEMFVRRAAKGQTFHQPYLGCREFAANFQLLEPAELAADRAVMPPIAENRDLGYMLYDLDFSDPVRPKSMFYRPKLMAGVITVPEEDSPEVLR